MLNINKFRAKIKLDNAISIKIFEKLGFQEVGCKILPNLLKEDNNCTIAKF